jgi:hypothetical protein
LLGLLRSPLFSKIFSPPSSHVRLIHA